MEIGMKAPGEMARRTEMESSTILTKASFMKAFGWMESQNVGLCLILGGMKHQHQQSIQFHRYNILAVATLTNNHKQQSTFPMHYFVLKYEHMLFFKLHLVDMQLVLKEAQSAYLD